jgi:hypothetical protein
MTNATPQPVRVPAITEPCIPMPHAAVYVDDVTGRILTSAEVESGEHPARLLHGENDPIPVEKARELGLTSRPAEGPPPVPGKRRPREDRAKHLREDR